MIAESIKILETPRDAMQGLHRFIPTNKKVELLNALIPVGFDIIDAGSFVSARAIPQMRDTAEVIDRIDMRDSRSKLFVLVVNKQGAMKASNFSNICYLGFPFSPSPAFLKKNINSDFEKAWKTINEIHEICLKTNKSFVVYLSMAFGNPYGDPEDPELSLEWIDKLNQIGIKIISLSDITGVATPEKIEFIYSRIVPKYKNTEFGIHLHVRHNEWQDKIDAAYRNGCRIFEGVINGLGGCPMTGYDLLGNLSTGSILEYAAINQIPHKINLTQFGKALNTFNRILG